MQQFLLFQTFIQYIFFKPIEFSTIYQKLKLKQANFNKLINLIIYANQFTGGYPARPQEHNRDPPVKQKSNLDYMVISKTAPSSDKYTNSIQNFDAQQLFQKFSKPITVSESIPIRLRRRSNLSKIDFGRQSKKPNFDQYTGQMKINQTKSVCPQQCIQIEPLPLNESHCTNQENQQNNVNITFSPLLNQKWSESEKVFSTSIEKAPQRLNLQRAIFNWDPFRDLQIKNQ